MTSSSRAGSRNKRATAGWVYLAVFIAIGLSLSMLGPSLTYLRERAQVSKGDIGALFVAQALGYLAGSLLSGRVYDRGLGHQVLAGALVGLVASQLLIPHCTSVLALAIPFAMIGIFAGCIDVGCNTLVVWHTRGAGSARLLNALHLFFGIGALASPLLVDRSLAWSHSLSFLTALVASYALVLAFIVLLHETPTPLAIGASTTSPPAQTPVRVLAVISAFFFLYVGVEVGFSGWLKTYAEGIHLGGASSPTLLNTAFWVSFTLGRLIAVVVASRVRSGLLLVTSCSLTIVLLGIMIIAKGSPSAVWLTTVFIGFAVAPQFATMIAYAEEHTSLSGRSTSWFVSGAGIGGLALPFLIGQLLDRSGSAAMPVAVFFAAIATAGWLLVVRHELLVRRTLPIVAVPATR